MKKQLLIFLTLLITTMTVYAQRKIQGSVTDASGNKIIGANILVKGTTVGTITNTEGTFSIEVPDGKNILIISYTGYEAKDLEIGLANTLDVTLNEGILLSETVITALGISRTEKSLGYAVSKINSEHLAKVRDQNIVNLFAGRAAGVTVIGSSGGNIGGSSRITIRGLRSLTGNNQPLFVVNGIPMDNSNFTSYSNQPSGDGQGKVYESQRDYGNAIQDLNPDDLDDISILKGQAATALYGSRGANGVIMVTTKKGTKHKNSIGVSVNSSLTIDRISVYPKFQKQYGGGVDLLPRGFTDNSGFYKTPYVELNQDGDTLGIYSSFDLVPNYSVDESSGTRFSTTTDQHFRHLESTGNYKFYKGFGQDQPNLHFRDWNSWDAWDTDHFGKSRLWEVGDDPIKFYQTGVTSSHNFAIDGGGDHSSFRLSYTRFDQKGIYPNSKLERNIISFNGSLDVTDRFQAFVGANYVNASALGRTATTYDYRGGFNPAQNFNQWWHTELRFADLKSYENPDGTMRTWNRQSADNAKPQYWDNPYWTRYKNYENDGRDRIFGNVGLTYKFNSWLKATGRVLTDFYSEQREERIAVGSLLAGQYTQDLYDVAETNTDLIVQAEKNLSDDFTTSAFIGANKLWHKIERNFSATIGGLNVPDIYRLQNSRERPLVQNTTAKKEIESFFIGASFGWRNMLYLDLSGRQDWSSALPDGANGYFYPSASVSWAFSEKWKLPKMSFGKIRFGLAQTGNDTDPYNLYTTYTSNPNFGSLANFTVSNTLNKVNLKPETTNSVELGVDLRFFQDRIGLDASVYQTQTVDQIIPLPTAASSGFENQFINAGKIRNRGLEIELHAIPVCTKNIKWETVFNLGKNRNELISLVPDDASVNSYLLFQPGSYQFVAQVGQPYGTIVGQDFLYDKSGKRLVDPKTGFYLHTNSYVNLGNITPDFTGGLTNTLSWKNWSLNLFFDFRKGGDIFSFTNALGRYVGLFEYTAEDNLRENGRTLSGNEAILDGDGNPISDGNGRYKSTGLENIKALSYPDWKSSGITKEFVYDGSFIKLREASLGWSLPEKWVKRAGMVEGRVSIVGRNIAILFKNLPNLDPDLAISTSNWQGNEGGGVPATRSLGFNLNFKF